MSHIHKYQRKKIGKKGHYVYACVIPGCSHHVIPELIAGREALCNRCGRKFNIKKRPLRDQHVKPHCDFCIKGRTGRKFVIETEERVIEVTQESIEERLRKLASGE